MSKNILITGGVGFLGERLTNYLLKKNYKIIVFDKLQHHQPTIASEKVIYIKGDILSKKDLTSLFKKHRNITTLYHLAAALPNKTNPPDLIWKTNVLGTVNLVKKAVEYHVKSFVFVSSNTIYGKPSSNPVTEETPLNPLEIYGKSKAEAEKQLGKYKRYLDIQIFRCPVISGIGRLGLQAILYDFISEDKNIYLLGNGNNKYQFVDAQDVCMALEKASKIKGFDIYNIGADNILTLKGLYQAVISYAESKSKIISLPKTPLIILLSIIDRLGISPLGVYQYSMLGETLWADTTKIKKKLNWYPQKTNPQMFIENYNWFIENRDNLEKFKKDESSANKSLPKMGILRLVKYFS